LGLGTLPLVDLPETVLLVLQPYAVEARDERGCFRDRPVVRESWRRERLAPFCVTELWWDHDPVVPMRRHQSPLWRLGRVSLL
ncbi:MAG: hypothetical protein ACK535_06310, partial [Cyanobacteriota bacterium]